MLSVRKGLKSTSTFQCPRFLPDLNLSHDPEGCKNYYGYYVRSKDKGFKLRRIRKECVTPKYFDPTVIKFLFIIQIQSKPETMRRKKENRNLGNKTIPQSVCGTENETNTNHHIYEDHSYLRTSKSSEKSSTPNKATTNKNTFSSKAKNNQTTELTNLTEDQSTNILIRPTQQCQTNKSSFVPLQPLINNKDRVQPKPQKSQIQVGETVLRVRELTRHIVIPKSQELSESMEKRLKTEAADLLDCGEWSENSSDSPMMSTVTIASGDHIIVSGKPITTLPMHILRQSYLKSLIKDLGPLQQRCPVCNMVILKRNLYRHVRYQHSQKKPRSVCPLCGKTFKIGDWLKDHIRRGHNYSKKETDELLAKIKPDNNMNLGCGGGGGDSNLGPVSPVRQSYLKSLMEDLSPLQQKCPVCNMVILKKNLPRHVRDQHLQGKPRSVCPLCGKTFKIGSWLKDHIRRGHNYSKEETDELLARIKPDNNMNLGGGGGGGDSTVSPVSTMLTSSGVGGPIITSVMPVMEMSPSSPSPLPPKVIMPNKKKNEYNQLSCNTITQSDESQRNELSNIIYKDVTSDFESDIEILEPTGSEEDQTQENIYG